MMTHILLHSTFSIFASLYLFPYPILLLVLILFCLNSQLPFRARLVRMIW